MLQGSGLWRFLAAEFISPQKVYTFSFILGFIIPKSAECIHSATKGFRGSGFGVSHPRGSLRTGLPQLLVHGWDRTKNLHVYSLLGLGTHKNVKCSPTMTKAWCYQYTVKMNTWSKFRRDQDILFGGSLHEGLLHRSVKTRTHSENFSYQEILTKQEPSLRQFGKQVLLNSYHHRTPTQTISAPYSTA